MAACRASTPRSSSAGNRDGFIAARARSGRVYARDAFTKRRRQLVSALITLSSSGWTAWT
jgi:hypothetical protein